MMRYIIYHAVLSFTQLQEVSYCSRMQGKRRCWKIPHCHHHNQSHHHHLHCPPCQQRQKQKTLAENITHKCISNHPKSCLNIFYPLNVWQWWSRELMSLELQFRIRSGTNSSIRCCYFVKLKHLHCPHQRLIIHLPHPWSKCQSNGREHRATIEDGGVRIKGTGTLRWLTISTIVNKCKIYWQHLCRTFQPCVPPSTTKSRISRRGPTTKVDTITQDQMDYRGIIPTSEGIAHPPTGGIVTMMGGINPMPGNITPITCCIIPITGNIVLLLMAAVIVPMTGSRAPNSGWQISNDGWENWYR